MAGISSGTALFSSLCLKTTHIIPEICRWLTPLTLAAASIAGLGKQNHDSVLQRESPCAAQDPRPTSSLSSAFSFLSASVIRVIGTQTLWTLLLLSVTLTRERQIYSILARQRIKIKLQIIARFQGYIVQDLILPETPRELQPPGEICLRFSN